MNNVVENGRFGEFGGQYAPETLMFALNVRTSYREIIINSHL